ncbi:hypothetical protein OHB01_31845 [Microbispora hainanensis]|jgi:hypothetical protein|nr:MULTISPECIES: hypothetical protein [Microbispora]
MDFGADMFLLPLMAGPRRSGAPYGEFSERKSSGSAARETATWSPDASR